MDSTAHRDGGGHRQEAPETRGLVMDWGWRYDLLVWLADNLLLRGRLRALRRRALELATPHEGESVLDVGCGTVSLALQAGASVGPTGRVVGSILAPGRLRGPCRRGGDPAFPSTSTPVWWSSSGSRMDRSRSS
jgi:hypothetical protein